MNRQDYLQFLQNSEVFKGLNEVLQKQILGASNEVLVNYIRMFQQADKDLLASKKEFMTGLTKTVGEGKQEIFKAKKSALHSMERDEKAHDNADNLLQKLNNNL